MESKDTLAEACWDAWFEANYSWDALQYKKIDGLGGLHGEVTLQDYWRRDPDQPSVVRTNDDLKALHELIADAQGKLWHVAHLPPRFRDGAQTWKADENHKNWQWLEAKIDARLQSTSEKRPDRLLWISQPDNDGRAQLSGAVLKSLPLRYAGEIHVKADDLMVLHRSFIDEMTFGSSASFQRAMFSGSFYASSCTFSNVSFEGAVFLEGAWLYNCRLAATSFKSAKVSKHFSLHGSRISGLLEFSHFRIAEAAYFGSSEFNSDVNFEKAEFGSRADFSSAHFSREAKFERTKFRADAIFKGAATSDEKSETSQAVHLELKTENQGGRATQLAVGSVVTPASDAELKRKSFRELRFFGAEFFGNADFSNRSFLAVTDFADVKFHKLAKFHDSKLHQDTTFAGAEFYTPKPEPIEVSADEARKTTRPPTDQEVSRHFEEYERAFRTLKLAMEGLRARREEARFYRMELRARRARPSSSGPGPKEVSRTEKAISHIYELTSDFGESLLKPLIALVMLWMIATGIYAILVGDLPFGCIAVVDPNCGISPSVAIAAERTWLPFLAQSAPSAQWWANAASAVQPWAGFLEIIHRMSAIVLIFLFALAARRKFQIS